MLVIRRCVPFTAPGHSGEGVVYSPRQWLRDGRDLRDLANVRQLRQHGEYQAWGVPSMYVGTMLSYLPRVLNLGRILGIVGETVLGTISSGFTQVLKPG